jgi:hypothetical protein
MHCPHDPIGPLVAERHDRAPAQGSDGVIKKPHDCRKRAVECKRLASKATSPEIYETLIYMAMRWHELADADEAAIGRWPPPSTTGD